MLLSEPWRNQFERRGWVELFLEKDNRISFRGVQTNCLREKVVYSLNFNEEDNDENKAEKENKIILNQTFVNVKLVEGNDLCKSAQYRLARSDCRDFIPYRLEYGRLQHILKSQFNDRNNSLYYSNVSEFINLNLKFVLFSFKEINSLVYFTQNIGISFSILFIFK